MILDADALAYHKNSSNTCFFDVAQLANPLIKIDILNANLVVEYII
jgi:hypothetical protein